VTGATAQPGHCRGAALSASCVDAVECRDKYGFATGHDDLDGHIAAAQMHLPATARDGDARVTLGMALVDWTAAKDGTVMARGTSVIELASDELASDGRIAHVTSFWL